MPFFNIKVVKSGQKYEVYYFDRYMYKRPYKSKNKANRKADGYNLSNTPELKSYFENQTDATIEYIGFHDPEIYTYFDHSSISQVQVDNTRPDRDYTRENMKRRKRKLKRLINSNEKSFSKFITLTFALYRIEVKKPVEINGKLKGKGIYFYRDISGIKDKSRVKVKKINDQEKIKDLEYTNYEFKKFKQRLKYRVEKENAGFKLKYISVPERHKSGHIHYHTLFNIPFMKSERIQEIWGNGFIKINQIKNIDDVGSYIGKYLEKDFEESQGKKKNYFRSRNLTKPQEFIDMEAVKIIEKLEKEGEKQFEIDFDNYCKGHYEYYSMS
ncbi:MAG: rolling circle replication-associated protein [Nanoarchaeota archaeon]